MGLEKLYVAVNANNFTTPTINHTIPPHYLTTRREERKISPALTTFFLFRRPELADPRGDRRIVSVCYRPDRSGRKGTSENDIAREIKRERY
ncbi:hypothetical protein Trydic_g12836 [Trypoxylus dichotomus]